METRAAMGRNARRMTAAAAGAIALGLFVAGASAHLERACVVNDTPYLPLCNEEPASRGAQQQLRERLQANPGDSWAWTKLLVAGNGPHQEGVLRAASTLAPNNGNVLRRRAVNAVDRGKPDEAVKLLVQMLRQRGTADAARILAQLAASPEGVALLRPYLGEAQDWLPGVLAHVNALKIPPGRVLPLVAEAMDKDALPDAARRNYMRSLKVQGEWLDAYGLWLAHQKHAVPLLYNGGFDQPFEPDGFDWELGEVPRSRAGVVVELQAVARRGLVLDIEFTGRRFTTPIARQHVFAPPGSYRLRGEYMAAKLRSEGGLVWNVVCASSRQLLAAQAAALQDTGGMWKTFQVDFTVPPDCGPMASIELEPAATFEAAAGIRGRVAFDAFSLARSAQ